MVVRFLILNERAVVRADVYTQEVVIIEGVNGEGKMLISV